MFGMSSGQATEIREQAVSLLTHTSGFNRPGRVHPAEAQRHEFLSENLGLVPARHLVKTTRRQLEANHLQIIWPNGRPRILPKHPKLALPGLQVKVRLRSPP